MPTTDTNVPQVVVNKLTKAQYEVATKEPTEFYVVTDEQIGTSDIADGAVTAAKIDGSTLYLESSTQTITISAGDTQTFKLDTVFGADYPTTKKIVSCLVVPTGGGSGANFEYHFQGVGSSLDQADYGLSITNKDSANSYTWTYKIILVAI